MYKPILLTCALLWTSSLGSAKTTTPASSPTTIIDEVNMASSFERDMDTAIKAGIPDGRKLAEEALATEDKTLSLPLVNSKEKKATFSYEKAKESIAVISSLYKCDKCESWHRGSTATAWVAAKNGIIVTNYHILEGAIGNAAVGVWLPNGKTYPVTKVLAVDPLEDIAVLKIDADDLTPLPLASEAPQVGSPVNIISHPESHFYLLTKGYVSRYYITPNTPDSINNTIKNALVPKNAEPTPRTEDKSERRQLWVNVTAEYARGSSGAPLLDDRGYVIGMVCSTVSIHSEGRFRPETPKNSEPPNFQMCLRNCVPQQALSFILRSQPYSTSADAAAPPSAP